MSRRVTLCTLIVGSWLGFAPAGRSAEPPVDLGPGNTADTGINYASAAVTHADGRLESFFRKSADSHVCIFHTESSDHARSWTAAEKLVELEVAPWGGPMPLLDHDGELHFVIPRVRGEGRRPNVDRFIDLYHVRSHAGRTQWSEPQRIYEGYVGAIQCLVQLSTGRIIAPFAEWRAGVPTAPPTGPSATTCVHSDDGGQTWQQSPAQLTAPCYENYNGGNYGACEPTLLELTDGRVWMLIRTQTGYLYESFSPDGVDWSPAVPSRFVSSNSPAFPIRLDDGRIVVFWNNCEMPPRVDGAGVYGGRDALHAAISADEGRTWHGYREVYRDPTRNGSPPKSGDRGTAYPHATLTGDGRILLVSGQGTERRRRFLIDPDWLMETSATADLSSLDEWHVFKPFGPAERWWRDRAAGAQLFAHPDDPDKQVLRVRHPEGSEPDGATWNFPKLESGRVEVRLRLEEGFGGAQIGLTDRYYDPCDDQGEQSAMFALRIPADGAIEGQPVFEPGTWHSVTLEVSHDSCGVTVDGRQVATLPRRSEMPNGLSYLRIRALEAEADAGALLVEAASARGE